MKMQQHRLQYFDYQRHPQHWSVVVVALAAAVAALAAGDSVLRDILQ